MIKMDFTTTAVVRPHILGATLKSFNANLHGINLKDCRMIINIDPLPPGIKRKSVIKVARRYFGSVKYNLPKVANFTAAYNWVLSNAETEYIFNLEDDWELKREIEIEKILEPFKGNDDLLQVLLRAYRYPYRTCALSPGVWHKRFYSAVGGNLVETINPEAQLRGKRFGLHMPSREKYGLKAKGKIAVYPQAGKQVVLKDLGRRWINRTKYKKTGKGKKARFITWELKG